jgi:hypothetical protein
MQTLSEFLVATPLYSWRKVQLPELAKDLDPGQMELACGTCGGKRPFRERPSPSGSGVGMPVERSRSIQRGVYYFNVFCGFCCKEKYTYMVEIDPEEQRARKVGQSPPWSIEIEKTVEDALGPSKDFFKRGLVCLSQGFGLGACIYFRRVLEEQVDSILSLLEQLLAMDPATQDEAERLAELRRGKAADKKLEKAYPLVPPSLVIDGINPLKLLYGQLSQGVHALAEDECCLLAEQMHQTLVYVVSELTRAVTVRDRFIRQVKNLNSMKFGGEAKLEAEERTSKTPNRADN